MSIAKNKISISKILKSKCFSRNYSKLQNALMTYRLFPYNLRLKKIPPKVYSIRPIKKKYYSLNKINNPVFQLDEIILKAEDKFEKTKERFNFYKDTNNLFEKNYKLLVKSSSDKNIIKSAVQIEQEKKDEQLFKKGPLLMKKKRELDFYYLNNSKNKKIKVSNEKSVKYLEKLKTIIKIKKSKNKDDENSRNKYLILNNNNTNNNNTNSNIIEKEISNEELIKSILQTNQSLDLLNENKNYLDEYIERKDNNKTTTTGFFSPNITNNSIKYPLQKILMKNSFDNNKSNINYSRQSDNEIRRKIKENSLITLPKTKFELFKKYGKLKMKKKYYTQFNSPKINNFNSQTQIECFYEKIKSNPKIKEEDYENISNYFRKESKSPTPINLKSHFSSFQLFNSIRKTQLKLQDFNVKNSVKKIYENRVPFETNKKFGKLDELDMKIKFFQRKFSKFLLDQSK